MNAMVEAHVFTHLQRLPALPEALNEVLRTLDDENATQRTIILTISRDLSLTTKMLRIANSSFYGLAYHVASIHDALMILGLRTVRSLAIATLLTTQMQKWSGSMSSLRHFFEHALETAIYCQLLANHVSIQSDTAFTVGLLHDIGKLAVVVDYPASTEAVFSSEEAVQDLRMFGGKDLGSFNHAELGGRILAHWHFPTEVQDAVRFHHSPLTHETSDLTMLVIAANMLNKHNVNVAQGMQSLKEERLLWSRLELTEEALFKIDAKAKEGFQELLSILHTFQEEGEGI